MRIPFGLLLSLLLVPGLALATFDGLDQAIARGDFGELKAVIISRHGEIVFEEYYRGAARDDLRQVQSVTKSIGSALVGVAHRRGRIRLDQTLDTIFAEHYDFSTLPFQGKAAITVEQVLQQRHGLAWDETSLDYRNPLNPVQGMINSGDWYRYVLSRRLAVSPGSDFAYSTGVSTLMSRIIRAATDMAPDAFASEALFEPLGIERFHWEGYSAGGSGTGLTDWPNPDGDPPLGFGLWLRPLDMLKFGQLYLDRGIYEGRRILDESWVDASWALHSSAENSGFFTRPGWGHGYQWWIAAVTDVRGRDWHVYFASGWGSQVVFVVPELGLVVVTSADNYDHNGQDVDVLLAGFVLPALEPILDSRFSGAWFDPATDGQGFNLEVLDDRGEVLAFWYTYAEAGGQRWFILQGEVQDGVGEVTIYETDGRFLQPDGYVLDTWGTGTFTPVDCDQLTFSFEGGGTSGSLALSRLSGTCFEPPEVN